MILYGDEAAQASNVDMKLISKGLLMVKKYRMTGFPQHVLNLNVEIAEQEFQIYLSQNIEPYSIFFTIN